MIRIFVVLSMLFIANFALATDSKVGDGLIFKKYIGIGYNILDLGNKEDHGILEKNLINFYNINTSLGARIHRNISVEISQMKTKFNLLDSSVPQGTNIRIARYDASTMFHLPILSDYAFELVGKVGISNIHYNISNYNGLVAKGNGNYLITGYGLGYEPEDGTTRYYIMSEKINYGFGVAGKMTNYNFGIIKYF